MTPPPVRALLFAMSLGLVAVVYAAEERDTGVPPPPPPPEESATTPPTDSGAIEPEITITSKGSEIHEEYRYNGVLYMVKVIPKHGPPYYLVYDQRGRVRRSDLEPDIIVPQWVIKRF